MEKRIQTVLGRIEPSTLGITMTHEHLSMQFEVAAQPATSFHAMSDVSLTIDNLWWIRQNPYSHHKNLQLKEEKEAVIEEMHFYKKNGGMSIVENTINGIDRDLPFLVSLSKETGVNIVAGTGYYVGASHPESMAKTSVEELCSEMSQEIVEGVDIGANSTVKCGVIGELGCSWPLQANEKKVLVAAAHAQTLTKCPVIIHPGRNHMAPFEIIRIFQEAGGNVSKTVMSHLDRTMHTDEVLLDFARMGCYCEFDLFGIEVSHYQPNELVDMPSDGERIRRIKRLIEEGFGDRVVIGHDIHTKHRLMKYGGHGYSHILLNVVPKMKKRGVEDSAISRILVDNPRNWLEF